MTRHIGQEDLVLATMSTPGQWAGGLAPRRARGVHGDGSVCCTRKDAAVPGTALHEVATSWFPFGVHIITGLMQTVRRIESMARQREKLIALGTLSAGLAHQLNNPAAAASRAVDVAVRGRRRWAGRRRRARLRSIVACSAEQCAGLEALRQGSACPRRPPTPDRGAGACGNPIGRTRSPTGWTTTTSSESWVIAAALADSGAGRRGSVIEVSDLLEDPPLGARRLELIAGSVSTSTLLTEVKDGDLDGSPGWSPRSSPTRRMDRASVASQSTCTDGLEEHGRDARAQAARRRRGRSATEPADLPRVEGHSGRAEPGLDQPDRQRGRRDGRLGNAAAEWLGSWATGCWSGRSSTTGRGCRPRCGPAPSTRSSPRRMSARAPGSGWTSRAASSSSTTLVTSRSSPARDGPRCRCRCRCRTRGDPRRPAGARRRKDGYPVLSSSHDLLGVLSAGSAVKDLGPTRGVTYSCLAPNGKPLEAGFDGPAPIV